MENCRSPRALTELRSRARLQCAKPQNITEIIAKLYTRETLHRRRLVTSSRKVDTPRISSLVNHGRRYYGEQPHGDSSPGSQTFAENVLGIAF